MKIYKPIGSKERFAEIFQGVTKTRLNEAFMSDASSMNPENVLNMAFEQLKSGGLKIEQSNSQGSGEQSYVELVCKDRQGNDITFTFKVQSSAGEQDGVYNVNGVMLTNFTFDSPDGEEVVELDESGLRRFNAQHGKELFDAIQQYITVEDEEPIDSLYEDAIKKIDSYPYGGGSDRMQTGKAYGDEKPINPAIRVKSPELDKFVAEGSVNEMDKPAMKLIQQGKGGSTAGGVKQLEEDLNSILHYSQSARDNGVLFPKAKEMGVTNQYILVDALKDVGVEVKNIVTVGDKYELILSHEGKTFKAMLKKSYGSAATAVKLIKNKLGIQEGLYEEETKNDYPDQLGKKFKPKDQMPKKKKKPQTAVKISENFEDNEYEEIPDLEIPTDRRAKMVAKRDISGAYGDEDKVEAGSDFHMDEKEEPEVGDDNVTDTEFMDTERQGLQGGEENPELSQLEKDNPDIYPDGWKEMDGMFMGPNAKFKSDDGMSHEPEADEIDQIAQEKEEAGEMIPGGKGEGKSAKEFDPEQILMGMRVEMEHTTDPMIALEITIDHLTEYPEYYTVNDENPEDSAQANAAKDAEGGEDKEMEDILLGFKPHNIGDGMESDEEVPHHAMGAVLPDEETEEEPEEEKEEQSEGLYEQNEKINKLITEEQIKTAKLTLSNRNIPTGMSKKEAVQLLMNNNLKKIL